MLRYRYIFYFAVLAVLAMIVFDQVSRLPDVQDLPAKVENFQKQVSAPGPLRGKIEAQDAFLTRAGVANWTNASRAENILPALAANSKLNAAAMAKVNDMFARQYFAHVSPIGEQAADLADQAGYEYIAIGENLALGNFENDEVLVQAWMDSPGHRANILGEDFTEIGVAVRQGNFERHPTWLAVQIFARPRTACPSVDEELRSRIDTNESRLSRWQNEIDSLRNEIDNMRPKHGDEYNTKVEQYNTLVNDYNSLLQTTKAIIEQYNAQVSAFNVCLNH